METNEYIIRYRGKASIERPLALDKEYLLESKVSVIKVEDSSNQDGTKNTTFVVEPTVSTIKNETGQKIEFKKKGKYSQALRYAIIMWARDNYPDIDDDVAYDMVMKKLLDNLDGLMPLIMKEN